VDSATHYLWLLPIRHKTADIVATTLFDEIISRVSVPSAILTDRGGEFLGEVVELLYKRLGMTHLKTSAYRPQTDAKCERVRFSVHNMITKLVGDKHDRWPDLLGTVALAYNATVHTSTGYSPHELFYSFAPACPLDALVTTPMPEPVNNADKYAFQAMERLQEATHFVPSYTSKQIQRMKQGYDTSVRPKQFEENDEVLLFDPRKKRGKYTKWSVTWIGPFRVKKRLNSCNYVLQKSAKSRPFVVHVNRMRPYLHELGASDTSKPPLSNASDMQGDSPTSSSQVLDANTPSQSTIAPQSVKAGATARPAAPVVSTHTDLALATDATAAPSTEVIDSITDTDTTVADMSGAGPASASQTDKPTSCSDSNFRADLANSTPAALRARNDDVNVDVANRPRPPQANRPQRSCRVPAGYTTTSMRATAGIEFRLVVCRHFVRLSCRHYNVVLAIRIRFELLKCHRTSQKHRLKMIVHLNRRPGRRRRRVMTANVENVELRHRHRSQSRRYCQRPTTITR